MEEKYKKIGTIWPILANIYDLTIYHSHPVFTI